MEGARHARRGDHGVGPPHQGVPHQPSTCLIRHLTQDWLLHPSLMSLRCGSSPPHIMSNGFTDWLFHPSLMSLWSGTSPLSPYIMSDLFTDWLLHPSLMSLWNGTSLHPPHHVRPLHCWNLPPPSTSCQASSQNGSSSLMSLWSGTSPHTLCQTSS